MQTKLARELRYLDRVVFDGAQVVTIIEVYLQPWDGRVCLSYQRTPSHNAQRYQCDADCPIEIESRYPYQT